MWGRYSAVGRTSSESQTFLGQVLTLIVVLF